MQQEEYQIRAAQLSSLRDTRLCEGAEARSRERELCQVALGAVGEFDEVEALLSNHQQVLNLKLLTEEFGDLLWYLVEGFTAIDVNIAIIGTPRGLGITTDSRATQVKHLHGHIARLAELVKKTYFGTKDYSREDLKQALTLIWVSTFRLMKRFKVDPSTVFSFNIAKLESRFGITTRYEESDVTSRESESTTG